MDCSTEVSFRRVGRKGLAGSAPSSAGASLNSWLGPLEVRFSQDCTLSSPTDCAVMRWAGCSAGIPAVYHSTRERRMLTRHCRAWNSSCKPQISNAQSSSVRGGEADDCELIVGQICQVCTASKVPLVCGHIMIDHSDIMVSECFTACNISMYIDSVQLFITQLTLVHDAFAMLCETFICRAQTVQHTASRMACSSAMT